ncbi:MAG: twin-arginine translocation signal domain-containing protein, partial [Armatimonadia bacterium]|nr:twin-arginine translocation signal domain-containing protein [Armatimonadia bacterium]
MSLGISRRSFLKGAAALAAPTIIPASALGLQGATPPSERINVGMIGTGRQALIVSLPQLLNMPDVQVVAVCDVDAWRLADAKKRVDDHYGAGCMATGDYGDVLARDDIDAVLISTPDHWHTPLALEAMEAGKDVALEKPITRTIAEGQALVETAARTARVFRVDSEFRSQPGVHRAAELVRNGFIGEIQRVSVGVPGSDIGCPPQPAMPVPGELDYETWQGPAPRQPYTELGVHPPHAYGRPGWMRHLFYCDGMVTNWGTHLNDGAMWATGLERTGPVEIQATGTYPEPPTFWNVMTGFEIEYVFEGGLPWTYRTDRPYFLI